MTVAAQTFTGAYDSFGRYRLKLTMDETAVNTSGNSSSGTATLVLEGAGGYDFNGWTTSGSISVNGYVILSWNDVRPSGSWSGSVTLATDSWTATHNTNGSKTVAVSASFNATGTPDSYGPGSVISVSGNYVLTDIARVPTAPPQATAANVTADSADLSWGASTFYGSTPDYAYYLSKVSDFASLVTSGWQGNDRTKTYTGLDRGTTYYHRNRAKDSEGTSAYSTARSFTTLHTVPDKPATPVIGTVTSSSVAVDTTDPAYVGAAVTGREVELRQGTTVIQTKTTADPTFTGVPRNAEYTVRFRVQNAIGWGPWSNDAPVTIPGTPPSAPSGYAVTNIAATSAMVLTGSIADNGGAVPTQMRVKVSTTASDAGLVQTVTNTEYAPTRIVGLNENTVYYVAAAAYNTAIGGGWGPYGSWVSFTTKNNVPNGPTGLSFTGITGTTATLQWTAPSDLNGSTILNSVILIATNPSMTANARTINVPAGSLSQVIDSLTPGTQYWVYVWTESNNGLGSYSAQATFTTTGGGGISSGVYYDVPGVGIRFCEVWYEPPVGGVPKRCEVYYDVAGVPKLVIA
jgi:hypothetical protein